MAATRIVTRIIDDSPAAAHQRHAKVLRDAEGQEYRVKQYDHTELIGTYHTDDKADAIATAKLWVFSGI